MVETIDFPRGWSCGNTALYLACQSGAEELYMCGFDGNDYGKPINNIYKGTRIMYPKPIVVDIILLTGIINLNYTKGFS